MSRAVELYYTVEQLAVLLQVSAHTVRDYERRGLFRDPTISDPERDVSVVEIGGSIRVTASAVNRFLLAHVRLGPSRPAPIAARSAGELRRKVAAQERELQVLQEVEA